MSIGRKFVRMQLFAWRMKDFRILSLHLALSHLPNRSAVKNELIARFIAEVDQRREQIRRKTAIRRTNERIDQEQMR